MAARVGLFGVLLLVVIPAVAMAQERSCRQVLKSDARRLFNARGHELIYFRDPVRVLCTGGLILEADSAVMNRTASTVRDCLLLRIRQTGPACHTNRRSCFYTALREGAEIEIMAPVAS
ncbi:MAG: phosphoribosyl-AMP cyclohydrolase [Nioella sp.]